MDEKMSPYGKIVARYYEEEIKMKKIELNEKEQERYEIIKAVSEGRKSKERASVELGVTKRQINRLISKYEKEGKAAFIHGNKERKPKHAFSDETKEKIINLYNQKYYDANFSHASELMKNSDGVTVSSSALRKIMLSVDVISPKAHRSTVKNLKKRLKTRQAEAPKKEQRIIESKLLAVEQAHSRRPRAAYYGELIQMDASVHNWFGNEKSYLHIAIDDYSGEIVAAYFDKEETLSGYYNLLYQILTTKGIPFKFLTDRRTIFDYKRKSSPSDDDDVITQFGFACKTLGIELQSTSVPQAKGRVERQFGTLQSRLVTELRLAGITNIKAANDVLPMLIQNINDRFSLSVDYTKSVFEIQPSLEKIDQILSVLSERVVDRGECVSYENKHYRLLDEKNNQINLRPGTKGLVAKTFSGNLYFSVDDVSYVLEEIPVHSLFSDEFDVEKSSESKPVQKHIPSKNHPWRNNKFFDYKRKFVAKYYLEV